MTDATQTPAAPISLGIDNLKKVIDLACELEQAGLKIAANKSNYMADLPLLVGELPVLAVEVPAAIAAWPNVMPEVKDLDAKEALDAIAYTMGKMGVTDAKATLIVNKAIALVFAGKDLVAAIKS